MKIQKWVPLAFMLLSVQVHAQAEDRGLFFKLGEKMMNFGGYSYLELEKKLMTSDKGLAQCLTEVAQAKFQQSQKEKELATCKGEAPASAPAQTFPGP